MPDWEKRVRELQKVHGCEPRLGAEQLTEITGHLEEVYLGQLQGGVDSANAEKRALSEVQDWRVFCTKIFEAQREETMGEMIKKLWLPSLVILILSIAGISGALVNGVFPHGFALNSQAALLLYVPWIFGSFALGILGALWARRIRAGRGATAVLFALPVLSLILLFFGRPRVTWSLVPLYPGRLLPYLASCFVGWVLIPMVTALVGIIVASKMNRKNAIW